MTGCWRWLRNDEFIKSRPMHTNGIGHMQSDCHRVGYHCDDRNTSCNVTRCRQLSVQRSKLYRVLVFGRRRLQYCRFSGNLTCSFALTFLQSHLHPHFFLLWTKHKLLLCGNEGNEQLSFRLIFRQVSQQKKACLKCIGVVRNYFY